MVEGARTWWNAKRGGAALPYDAEVEYLESTGNQYINTLWIPDMTATTTITLYLKSDSGDPQIGCINNGGRPYYNWHWTLNLINFYFGDQSSYLRVTRSSTDNTGFLKKSTISYNGATGAVVMGGKSYTAPVCNGVPSDPFYLFARNNGNVAQLFCKAKFYNFNVKNQQGDFTVDMIPVRFTNELGNSEGAMYDRVSGALFRNAGTGAFVIGPDKS